MTERRRYNRKTKVAAVTAAAASSVMAASEETGIPRRTIGYWLEQPEFAELRRKTREDMADASKAIAHLALDRIKERIDEFKPGDLTILYGVMVDKAQLLVGQPTTVSATVTAGWNDHEKDTLKSLIDAELAEREEA